MGIKQTVKNVMDCDREGCDMAMQWNPQPGPTEKLPTKLNDVVGVEHPMSGSKKLYCSKHCAILDLNEDKHLPVAPSVLTPTATDADVKKVVQMAKATGSKLVTE